MRAITITQTCLACPSQWEGELDDGRFFYARYRWGGLTFSTGESLDAAVMGTLVYEGDHGEGLDGWMDTETMAHLVGLALATNRKPRRSGAS
jgi:hypothetical protein